MARFILRRQIIFLIAVSAFFGALTTIAQSAAGLDPYFPEALNGSTPSTPEPEPCAPYDPDLDLSNDPDYGVDTIKAFPRNFDRYYHIRTLPRSSMIDLDLRVYHFNAQSKSNMETQDDYSKICVCIGGTQQLCRPAYGIYDRACYWTLDNVPANISPTGRVVIFGKDSIAEDQNGDYRANGIYYLYNYLCQGGLEHFDGLYSSPAR